MSDQPATFASVASAPSAGRQVDAAGRTLRRRAVALRRALGSAAALAVVMAGWSPTRAADYAAGGGIINAPSGFATAIGDIANATGVGATAVGHNSRADGEHATAVGSSSAAFGQYATATGSGSFASGQNAAAFGVGGYAAGEQATALGTDASAIGETATAVGYNSRANGTATTAIGQGSRATADGTTALGTGAQALGLNSVAIGTGSVATLANTVSFGAPGAERRLTNVAAGVNPTDAVNMSQLTSVQSQVSSLQAQIGDTRIEARRGIAAAVATASPPMPSAPGKLAWQVRGSTFQSEYGLGFGVAYRLNTSVPLNVIGGYGNGGGREHTAYVGLGGEF